MDHMQIVRQAFGIVRNNKVLWLLALVTALGGLILNIFNYFFQVRVQSSLMDPFASPGQLGSQMGGSLLLSCLTILVFIIFFLVSLAVQGGIVHAVDRIDEGQAVSFGDAFRAGWEKVWRLFGTLILLYAPAILFYLVGLFGIITVLTASSMSSDFSGASGDGLLAQGGLFLACMLSLFCVYIFLIILVAFIYPFAMRGIVLRQMGIREGIGHGWRVLRGNLGSILILAFIFFLIYLLVYAILTAVSLPFMLPLFSAFSDPTSMGDPTQFFNSFYRVLIPFVIGGAFITLFLLPWQSAAFTLAYKQFTEKKPLELVIEPTI